MAQGADIPHERFLFGGPKGVLPVAKISQMHGKMTVWCQSELDTIIIKFLEPHILLQAFFQALCSFFAPQHEKIILEYDWVQICRLVATFCHVCKSFFLMSLLPGHHCQDWYEMPDFSSMAFQFGWLGPGLFLDCKHGCGLIFNSEFASFSICQTFVTLPGPSCFLHPGGKAQACRIDPAILDATPKSMLCRTSKLTL